MKKLVFVVFLISFIHSFSQEKKERQFSDPAESFPRFFQDINLSEKENIESFKKRIMEPFESYFRDNDISKNFDSTYNKIYFSFKIDSSGNSKFLKIRPEKLKNSKLVSDMSLIVDSLPKFIPARQYNRPVNIIYTIPISKNR